MFITASKLAMVEALREVFDSEWPPALGIKPKAIDIEYAERSEQWPFVLVQFNPGNISWTGINPDEFTPVTGIPNVDWSRYRQGMFDGNFQFTILALSSGERDRLLDAMMELFMFGRLNPFAEEVFTTLEDHDLIGITLNEATMESVAASVGVGTPWETEELIYEASFSLSCFGTFYADAYNQQLVALDDVLTYPLLNDEVFVDDGRGAWVEPEV